MLAEAWAGLAEGFLNFKNSVNSLNSLEFKSTGFLNLKSPGVFKFFKFFKI